MNNEKKNGNYVSGAEVKAIESISTPARPNKTKDTAMKMKRNKARRKGAEKSANTKAKKAKRRVYTNPPGDGTIGAAVLKVIQAKGATRESVLATVKKMFPESRFDRTHLSWYRNRFAQDLGVKVELKST